MHCFVIASRAAETNAEQNNLYSRGETEQKLNVWLENARLRADQFHCDDGLTQPVKVRRVPPGINKIKLITNSLSCNLNKLNLPIFIGPDIDVTVYAKPSTLNSWENTHHTVTLQVY